MMKKTLLAVALPALLASGTASAATIYDNNGTTVDFYGQIRLNLEYASKRDQSGEHGTKFRDSGSRFGFKIKHDLGNGLRALAGLEYGNNTQSPENNFKIKNRLGYVGVGADGYGDLTFGRVLSPFDDVALSDYTYVYGGVLDFGGNFKRSDSENNFIGRTSNTVKFMTSLFGDFRFGGTYTLQDGESWNNESEQHAKQLDNAFTLAVFYDNTERGLKLNAGFGRAEANGGPYTDPLAGPADLRKGTDMIYGIGAEYFIEIASVKDALALAVDLGRFDTKRDTTIAGVDTNNKYSANLYGVGLKYRWSEKGNAYIGGYYKDGQKDADDWSNKLFVIGSDYRFSKYARPYIEYAYEKDKLLDQSENESKVALGMRIYW